MKIISMNNYPFWHFPKRNISLPFQLLILFILLSMSESCKKANGQNALDYISVPYGFSIEVYASGIVNARSMTLGDDGTLFVGTRSAGNVYAIVDKNKDFKADTFYVIASGLRMPNGVAFMDGSLYVAEISRILRYDHIETKLQNPPDPVVIYDKFPVEEHHGWKYLAFGPDGKLYTQIGAPCNICESENPIYATICRLNKDGTGLEIFARGVRNTVGFTWHPVSGDLWFTDNGRDWLGDNRPPDELNRASKQNQHFGYPYCHGGDLSDPEFGKLRSCTSFTPPVQKLGAHVAPLGLKFYTGQMFPEEYKNMIFIAEHGSWNRTLPTGYRITTVLLDKDYKALEYKVFAEGWLKGFSKKGRPVDIIQLSDGSILVSDDYADMIYRISYKRKK